MGILYFIASWAFHVYKVGAGALQQVLFLFPLLSGEACSRGKVIALKRRKGHFFRRV